MSAVVVEEWLRVERRIEVCSEVEVEVEGVEEAFRNRYFLFGRSRWGLRL